MNKDIRLSVNGKEFDRLIKIEELFRILESRNINPELIKAKYAEEDEWQTAKDFINVYRHDNDIKTKFSTNIPYSEKHKADNINPLIPPPLPQSFKRIKQSDSNPSNLSQVTSRDNDKVLLNNTGKIFLAILLLGIGFFSHSIFIKEKIKIVEKPIEIIKEVPQIIEKKVEVEKPIPEEYILAHQISNALVNAQLVKEKKDNLEGVSGFKVVVTIGKDEESAAGVTERNIKNKIELLLRKHSINVDDKSPNTLYFSVNILESNPYIVYSTEMKYIEKISIYRPNVNNVSAIDEPNCNDSNTIVFKSSYVPLWVDGCYGIIGKSKISGQLLLNADNLATSFANEYLSVNR